MLMEYFLLRKNSSMYHRPSNSVTHIRPKSGDDAIFRYRAEKRQQWSMVLEMCRYTVEHVAASETALSDLLSKWIQSTYHKKRVSVVNIVPPLGQTDFQWPSLEEIREKSIQGTCGASSHKLHQG